MHQFIGHPYVEPQSGVIRCPDDVFTQHGLDGFIPLPIKDEEFDS